MRTFTHTCRIQRCVVLQPLCCKNSTVQMLNAEFPQNRDFSRCWACALTPMWRSVCIMWERKHHCSSGALSNFVTPFFFSISKLSNKSAAQACPSLRVTGNPFSLSAYIKMGILQKRCSCFPDGGLSVEDSLILHSIGFRGQFRFAYQILLISIGCTLLFSRTRQHWRNRRRSKNRCLCCIGKKTNFCSLATVILLTHFGSSCCKWM